MRYQIGDKIRRPSSFGYHHFGTYVGRQWPYNQAVVHSSKNDGVRLDSLDAFAGGKLVTIVDRVTDWREKIRVVQRASHLLGKPYSLLRLNCEHIANYVQKGVPTSPQLQGAVLTIGLTFLVLFLFSRKSA